MLLFCIRGKDTRENCAAIFRTTVSVKKRHTMKNDYASDINNGVDSTIKGIADVSSNDTKQARPPINEYRSHFTNFQTIVLRVAIGGGFAIVFVIIFTLLYYCFSRGSKKKFPRKKSAKDNPEKHEAESSTSASTEPGETHEMITAASTATVTATTSASGYDLTATMTTGRASV
ncbi:unnamed protein product [Cylicocyclus nassatus]|uniref:Uncharacterized protein n=1 Tax=Cylicocyclus nassatus TaxID=53992 RepID=A0AA36DL11_CYLNA|nr:unnamed protein product [Cylicocyclus nassatus]